MLGPIKPEASKPDSPPSRKKKVSPKRLVASESTQTARRKDIQFRSIFPIIDENSLEAKNLISFSVSGSSDDEETTAFGAQQKQKKRSLRKRAAQDQAWTFEDVD